MDLSKEIKKLQKRQLKIAEECQEARAKERAHLDTLTRCCIYYVSDRGKVSHSRADEKSASMHLEHGDKDLLVAVDFHSITQDAECSFTLRVKRGKHLLLEISGSYTGGVHNIQKRVYCPGADWERRILYAK